jgi:broad-specificity NMP kinase
MIIHLNGWPGTGKKTIGSVLADNLQATFVHNHLLHDVAIVCAGFDSSERWAVYEKVRAAAYEALLKRPYGEIFVMTNALCKGSSREAEAWRHVVELAIARQVPLIPVVLTVEVEENVRRLQSPERVGAKLTDPAELQSYFEIDTLQCPDVPETFVLDVTHLSAARADARIQSHVETIAKDLLPATKLHLRLR